jgi:citrate synthase
MPTSSFPYRPGLEGVVAAQTAISGVDGEKGELVIRGFAVEDLAPHVTFEDTVFLLWHDVLPDAKAVNQFSTELASRRELEGHTVELLKAAAARRVPAMDALRMACASLTGDAAVVPVNALGTPAARREALRLVAAFPVIVAAYHRLSQGLEPIAPRKDLLHTANFLYMLSGREAPSAFIRALDTYWNTVSDHGLNASTFTARVIVSTGSDLVSAVTGAVGALKGPLHGGAPGPALDLVFEIGSAERAERILREKLARGERLMGFGHRVYRTRDPRANVLGAATETLFERAGNRELYELARAVEACALPYCASTSLPGRCTLTWNSTQPSSCMASSSRRRSSPRCLRQDALRAGPRIAWNRSPPIVCFVRSPSTSVLATAGPFRTRSGDPTRRGCPGDCC